MMNNEYESAYKPTHQGGNVPVAMYNSLGTMFEQTVDKYPNKEAIYDVRKNVRWTYAEWDRQVNRLAHALKNVGVQKGDRVSHLSL